MARLSPVPVRFHGLFCGWDNAAAYSRNAPVPNGFFNVRFKLTRGRGGDVNEYFEKVFEDQGCLKLLGFSLSSIGSRRDFPEL
jgi:hypothetical protein